MLEPIPAKRVFTKGILAGIALVFALLAFNTWLAYWNDRQIKNASKRVTYTNDVLDALEDVLHTVVNAETGERGFIITGEPQYLPTYNNSIAKIPKHLDRLKSLIEEDDDSEHKVRYSVLRERVDAKLKELAETIELRKTDPEAARQAVSTHFGRDLMDGVRKQIDLMVRPEREELRIREAQSQSSYLFALVTDVTSGIFSLGALGVAVSLLHRNLGNQAKAAAEIFEQREWFRTTIGSIGDGVIATDIEGRVRILNGAAQAMTGWTEEEAAGKPLEEVFGILDEQTREKRENPVAKVLQSGQIVELSNHTALISKDGVERNIADSAAPIRDAGGKIIGVVLVFRDVTESKRMEETLARLASFPMLNPSPVMEADFSGRIHYLNPAIKRSFPDLEERGREHPWLNDWEAIVRAFREEGLSNVTREVTVDERYFQQAIHYVRNMERIRIYGMDITARKRAEMAQSREKANLQAIFDVVNVGMLLIDEAGSVRRVNDTVSRWLGKDLAAHLGLQPGGLVGCVHAINDPSRCGQTPHCELCPVRQTFESVLRDGEPIHDVESVATLVIDGKEVLFWVEASADPLLLDGRRYVVLALSDITARKRVEESLQRTAEELARSNRDLEQFAYIASHDLQEPLRMVAGYLQLLEDRYKGQLDEKADKFIAYSVDGAERMSRLIRDLLDFSRVNTHGNELCDVDSETAFDSALRNLDSAIRDSAAEITHDPLPTVRADSAQLARVFQNLIGNAIKFRAPDRPPRIHVGVRGEDGQRIFSVRDNGIGFEQQYEDKIFMIFQRLHGRGHYPGTGIGLAICKRIVERHGGTIWAAGTPDEGATFFFTLPT
jgi:PAS domain S-box-containing protein